MQRFVKIGLYTVPFDAPGRLEAQQISNGRQSVKQNLIVTISYENDNFHGDKVLYNSSFEDHENLHRRTEMMAKRFHGSWSRRTGDYDDASFKIKQTGELVKYFENLKRRRIYQANNLS